MISHQYSVCVIERMAVKQKKKVRVRTSYAECVIMAKKKGNKKTEEKKKRAK